MMRSKGPEKTPRPRLLDEFPVPGLDQWRAEVERLLKGAPFAQKMFTRTLEGITVGPMYTRADTEDLPWAGHHPGQAPFLRGSRAQGMFGSGWLVAQELLYPTAEEFNQALRHDLKRGQGAICLTLDRAGLNGQDPDQAERGSVGFGGTSLASLSEMTVALDGVELEDVPLCVQPGSAALPFAAMLVALVKKQSKDVARLRGSLGSDPIYGLARLGKLPVNMDQLYDELAVLTRWALEKAPGVTTLPIYEMPWHMGGADTALSLGLTLASAVNTLRAMDERGVPVGDASRHVRFRTVVGTDFFMEIAKLRALRLLWSDIIAASGCPPEMGRVLIHAQTSLRCMSVLDPHVNLLRTTTMAMSAVLGGTDSLHVSPFDEVDSLPDEFSRRIARNIQLILAQECHFEQVTDPAGGSWYVEKLTAELAEKAWGVFQEIEAAGGIVAALKSGIVQERIARAADHRREMLATGRMALVGVNRYPNGQEEDRRPRLPDLDALYKKRKAAMPQLRTTAAHEDHLIVLGRLEKILTAGSDQVFDVLVEAASQGATLGEMTGMLRHSADKQIQVEIVPARRDAEPFENLRGEVKAASLNDPRKGRVFCACLGDFAAYMPRLDFVRGFFQVGGFAVASDQFFTTADEAARAARGAEAATVILVGLDETYADLAVPLVRKLAATSPRPRILLAGQPTDLVDKLTEAGVDRFIQARSNLLEVLGELVHSTEVGS
jgi:methylmalonyl-CoA mutase